MNPGAWLRRPGHPPASRPPTLVGSAWLSLLVTGVTVTAPGTLAAQGDGPVVTVRAETRIELHVERQGDRLQVRGVLRDDRGTPLVGRALDVAAIGAAGTESTRLTTDHAGTFARTVPVGAADQVVVSFGETPLYAGTRVERSLDPERADVRLGIAVSDGGRIDLDGDPVVITVTADSDAGKQGLRVHLEDEMRRPLADGVTDARGRVTFRLEPTALGPPGPGRVVAIAADDGERSRAATEYPIVRSRGTALTLESSGTRARAGFPLRFEGRLTVAGMPGQPVPGAPVGVFAGGAHLGTDVTDDDGRYVVVAPLPSEAAEREVVARFEAARPGLSSSTSPPILVTWVEAEGRFFLWALVPIALTALALWALRRRAGDQGGPEAPARSTRAPGLVPGGGGRGRRGGSSTVGGRVVDVDTGRGVAPARVTFLVEGSTEEHVVDAAPDGAFAGGPFPDGALEVRVEAAGFAPHHGSIRLPHRGEWAEMEVRLRSLRRAVADAYRGAVLPRLPDQGRWAWRTNRELADEAGAREPGVRTPLADLEGRVAAIYYGPGPAPQAEVDEVLRAAGELEPDAPER